MMKALKEKIKKLNDRFFNWASSSMLHFVLMLIGLHFFVPAVCGIVYVVRKIILMIN